MIKHKLIDKGSIAHSLISSISEPNVFIPVKVVIKDIKFDEYNPLYLVKIIKFYDSIYFLKSHFMNHKFSNGFDKKARPFWIKDDLRNTNQLQNHLEKEDSRFFVVVDSIHTFRYKNDMTDMFNKLQDFLIYRNIQELQELTTRNSYSGQLKFSSKTEFFVRLKRMINDKIVDLKLTWDEFTRRF
tara:strand:+ start:437 stop:991 length:555 start_codon:yes stop_codon:yes gene_type:complete